MNGRKMDLSMTTRSRGCQAHVSAGLENEAESSGKRMSRSNSFSSVSSHTSNSETTPAVKSHHRTRSSANSSRSSTPTPPVGKEGRQSNPSTPVTGTNKTKDSKPTPASGKKRSLSSMLEAGDTPSVPPPKLRKIGKNDGTGVNNKNDYFCWICHRDGNVIVCKVCPRVYHTKCLGLQNSQPKDWVCPECEKILRAECVDTRSKSMSMITLDQLCMLLKFALERMQHPTSGPFEKPVDLAAVPLYGDYIYNPMDLGLLEKNIDNRMYGCTEAFLADAKWILHNCIIYNGTHHKLTSSAKLIVKICKHETNEIEICPDCYMNSCLQRNDNWFCEPCRTPHTLVWAKLKGYPFWPAKALREVDGQVDVRFFGAHDRSWVPVSQVFLLSETIPTAFRNKKAGGFDQAMEELQIHIDRIREEFGSYEYAQFRTPYDKNNVYLHNKMKINDKIVAKSAKSLLPKSTKATSSPKAAKQSKERPGQVKNASEAKTGESKSTVTKTASAVKIKYNSIITTRRAAAAKVAAVGNGPSATESESGVSSTSLPSGTPNTSVSLTDKVQTTAPIQSKLDHTGGVSPVVSTSGILYPASNIKAATTTTTLPPVLTLKPGDIHRLRIQKITVRPKLEQALTNMAERDSKGTSSNSVQNGANAKEKADENTQAKSSDELDAVNTCQTFNKVVSSVGSVGQGKLNECCKATSAVCSAGLDRIDSSAPTTSEKISSTNVSGMNSSPTEGESCRSEKYACSASGEQKSALKSKSYVTSNEIDATSNEVDGISNQSSVTCGISASSDSSSMKGSIALSENSAGVRKADGDSVEKSGSKGSEKEKIACASTKRMVTSRDASVFGGEYVQRDSIPAQSLKANTSICDNSVPDATENKKIYNSDWCEESKNSLSVEHSTCSTEHQTSTSGNIEVLQSTNPRDQDMTEDRTSASVNNSVSTQAEKRSEVSPGKSQYLEGLSKTIESCKAKLGIDGSLDDLSLQLDGASTEEDSEDRSESEGGSDSDEDLEDPISSTEADNPALEFTNQKREKTELAFSKNAQQAEDSNCNGTLLSVSSVDAGKSAEDKMSQETEGEGGESRLNDVTSDQSHVGRKRLSEDSDVAAATGIAEQINSKKVKLDESSNKANMGDVKERAPLKCYAENSEDVSETGGLIMEVDTDTDSNNLVIDLDENDVVLTPRKPGAQKGCEVIPVESNLDGNLIGSENKAALTPLMPKDKTEASTTKAFKTTKGTRNIATLSSLGVQAVQPLTVSSKGAKEVGYPRTGGYQGVSGNQTIVTGTKTWRPPKASETPVTCTNTQQNISIASVSSSAAHTISSASSMFVTAPSAVATPTSVVTPPVGGTLPKTLRPTLVSTPTVLTLKSIDGSNQLLKVMSFGNKPRPIAPAPSTPALPSNALLVSVPPPVIMSPQRKGSQQLVQGQTAVPGTILSSPVTSPCQPQLQTAIDLSLVHKINVEKYSEKIAAAVKASVDEMYRDLSNKNTFQTGLKYLQLELEQMGWRHKRQIDEIKHNVELTLSEMKKGMETEKHALVEELKKKYEGDIQKAVDETKKKQWCANCGKEAIFYCCWNTSYCDYPCQTAHWPQHMDSCTQSQSPEQSAAQSNQSHSTNAPTPQTGNHAPGQGGAAVANKEDGNSRLKQRNDWVQDSISSNLVIQQEQNDIGRRGMVSASANGTSHMRNSSNQILSTSSPLVHAGSTNAIPFSGTRQLADQTSILQVGQVMSGQIRQLTQPAMGLTEQMLRGNQAGQLQSQGRQMLQAGQGGQLLQTESLQLQYIAQQGQAPHPQACQVTGPHPQAHHAPHPHARPSPHPHPHPPLPTHLRGYHSAVHQIGFPITNQQGIALLQQRPLMQQNNSMLYPIVSQGSQGQVVHRGPIMFSKNQQQRSPATMDAQNPFQIQSRPF